LGTTLPVATFSSSVTQTINPLVANYTLTIPDGSQARIQFGLTTSYGTYTWWVPAPAGGGSVTILVAGMLPASVYYMSALVQLQNGTTQSDVDHTFTSGDLPLKNIPRLTVTSPGNPNPGVELVNLNPLSPIVTDLQGNIIWYYYNQEDIDHHGHPMPLKTMPNGNMIVLITNRYAHVTPAPAPYCVLREVDLASQTVSNGSFLREIHMKDLNEKLKNIKTHFGRTVQVNYFSHDFCQLANGHVILICQEFVTVPYEGVEIVVMGDALVDLDDKFDPKWVWSAFDVLDINRHPFEWTPGFDWTHCNCIQATPDGNLMLSVRNQSWVLKLDYTNGTGTGAILWKLGYQGDFTLSSGGVDNWFFQQHYPNILTTSGSDITTMSVIDNGNQRADPGQTYSRGLLLSIDETQKTADVTWQYPVTPSFFSYWGGDVVPLPNGNIEICMSQPFPEHSFAVEVTTSQQLVWQMDIHPADAYRSYRIPSLYPNVQW
jgi:arylsulfate sulfotransferase